MLKNLAYTQIVILSLAIGLFTNCNGEVQENESKSNTTVGSSITRPVDEAKIEISISDYEIKVKTLESLESLPVPELKFVFDSKSISVNEAPEEIKTVLNNHWKEAIKFFYNEKYNKAADGNIAQQKDMAWLKYCQNTHQQLQKLDIDAPNGKRKISQTEATKLWGFLNKSAVVAVDKVESF